MPTLDLWSLQQAEYLWPYSEIDQLLVGSQTQTLYSGMYLSGDADECTPWDNQVDPRWGKS